MKVKCPSCSAVGKVPVDRLPAQGANIRCPSCSFVFFVGGPTAQNVVDATGESGRLPVAPQTITAPGDQVQEALRAARDKAAKITQSLPSVAAPQAPPVATAPAAAPPSAAPEAAEGLIPRFENARPSGLTGQHAAISSEPEPAAAPAPAVDATAAAEGVGSSGRYSVSGAAVRPATPAVGVRALEQQADHQRMARLAAGAGAAATAAATESAAAATTTASAARTEAPAAEQQAKAPTAAPESKPMTPKNRRWRMRMESGITFDFGDTDSLRDWLMGQKSHEGISLQADGTGEFQPYSSWSEFADVRAAGYRTRYSSTASVGTVRSTGSVTNAAPMGPPAAAPASANSDAPPTAPGDASAPPPRRSSTVPGLRQGAAPGTTGRLAPAEDRKPGGGTNWTRILLAIALVGTIGAAVGLRMATTETTVAVPDTPVGDRLRWLLDEINGGAMTLAEPEINEVFASQFLTQVSAPSVVRHLKELDDWQAEYRLMTIMPGTDAYDLRARVTTPGGHIGEIRLFVEETAPHKVLGMRFQRILSP